MVSNLSGGKSPLAAAFESLKRDPIPLTDPATLASGVRFLLIQLPFVVPLYATLFMERFTGRSFSEALPKGVGVVGACLGAAYFMWTVGAADRRRLGLPIFGQQHPARLIRTGLSIWWRALIVAVRLVLVFVVLGIGLRVFGARQSTIENILTLASFLGLIPAWGFAVRFWDRSLAQASATPASRPLLPQQRHLEFVAVGLVWISVGATWWHAEAVRRESTNPCRHTPMTLIDATRETRVKAPVGRYEAYVSVRDGRQTLQTVNLATGAVNTVRVQQLARFVSFGYSQPFDDLYYVFEDSTGRQIIESVSPAASEPINYTIVNRHVRLALSADARQLTQEWGTPGSCAEIAIQP